MLNCQLASNCSTVLANKCQRAINLNNLSRVPQSQVDRCIVAKPVWVFLNVGTRDPDWALSISFKGTEKFTKLENT